MKFLRAVVLLLASLAMIPSPAARAQAPAEANVDDKLPVGAVVLLGTDRQLLVIVQRDEDAEIVGKTVAS